MTLIAAIEGQNGLVLASDSRGTIGDPRGLTAINDVHKKIFKISDYCGIAFAGSSEIASRLLDRFQTHLQGKNLVDVDPIIDELFSWGRKKYQKWFGARPFVSTGQKIIDQRPSMHFLIAGYNKQGDGKSRIYLLNSNTDFVPQLCTSGHMLAGVPQYAIYLLHRLYNPEMRLENIESLAAYLIEETATQDPKVGGPVKMASITTEDGYKELSDQVIAQISAKNEEQNRKLREFFFEGDSES